MASEVNQASAELQRQEELKKDSHLDSTASPEATEIEAPQPVALEGYLCSTPSGPLRALQLITGVALLRWLGLAMLQLLGYAHPARLQLRKGKLCFQGKRRLLGLDLGATQQAIPLAQLVRITMAARSGAWALIAALAVMLISAAGGSLLVLWGIAGRQVSWGLLGFLVLAGGVLLDALAYLLVQRNRKAGLVDLEVHTARFRLRLRKVPEQAAAQLVERLGSMKS